MRFTTRGDTFFAILLGKPGKELEIKALGGTGSLRGVELLGSRERVNFSRDESGLKIQMPAGVAASPAMCFKITGLER